MTPQRILILGGLILILIGIVFGFVHAGLNINSLRDARLDSAQLALDYLAKDQTGKALAYLEQTEQFQELWERYMDAHSHVTLFGFQALLFAYLLPYISLNQKLLFILAFFMVFGGLFLPTGVLLEAFGFEKLGFLAALLGGSWVLLATLGFTLGFLIQWKNSSN